MLMSLTLQSRQLTQYREAVAVDVVDFIVKTVDTDRHRMLLTLTLHSNS